MSQAVQWQWGDAEKPARDYWVHRITIRLLTLQGRAPAGRWSTGREHTLTYFRHKERLEIERSEPSLPLTSYERGCLRNDSFRQTLTSRRTP